MLRRSTLAVPFALAALLLAGCGHDGATTSSADADAAVTEPAPATAVTPATPATAPTAPTPQEHAVQPQQPGQPGPSAPQPSQPRPGTPKDALDVELFAFQALSLAADGAPADAADPKAIVVLVARGKHRSGGWTSELVELPIRIFPPEFELRTTPPPPESMNIQMISPFTSAVWVRMDQPVPSLKVRVGGEVREVKVEPANKAKNAMPAGR